MGRKRDITTELQVPQENIKKNMGQLIFILISYIKFQDTIYNRMLSVKNGPISLKLGA